MDNRERKVILFSFFFFLLGAVSICLSIHITYIGLVLGGQGSLHWIWRRLHGVDALGLLSQLRLEFDRKEGAEGLLTWVSTWDGCGWPCFGAGEQVTDVGRWYCFYPPNLEYTYVLETGLVLGM